MVILLIRILFSGIENRIFEGPLGIIKIKRLQGMYCLTTRSNILLFAENRLISQKIGDKKELICYNESLYSRIFIRSSSLLKSVLLSLTNSFNSRLYLGKIFNKFALLAFKTLWFLSIQK